MQRRRERRYSVWESVVLTIPGVEAVYRPATVVDISRSGYRILSGANLPVGTEVIITLNPVVIFGCVRHCEPYDGDTFTAGIQISKVSSEHEMPWSLPSSAELLEA